MDGFSDRGSTPLASTIHFHGKCEIKKYAVITSFFVVAAYIFFAKKGRETAKIAVFLLYNRNQPTSRARKSL